LIHYNEGESNGSNNNCGDNQINEDWCFFIRPGLDQFLKAMSRSYELVLYTAAMRDYANYFLASIDPDCEYFKQTHILCREHCTINKTEPDERNEVQYYAIKDIRLLGRDMDKCIIVDNLEDNFKFTTPCNGVHIMNFEGDMEDRELSRLQDFLEGIVNADLDDVRPSVRKYAQN
jgi:CTD small phosphatase-like protein 2